MHRLASACFRRNVVNIHRLVGEESIPAILCRRNFSMVPPRLPEVRKTSRVLISLRSYSSSSSTPTSVPPQPPPTTDVKEEKKKPTLRERYFPHYKDPDDNTERLTEQMLVEAAYTKDEVPMTFQEKVKENTRTAWYTGVVLVGLCALVSLLWAVWDELFNRDSVNNIYSKSFKIIYKNTEAVDALGWPIHCYGEETRRGWRRHVLHAKFTHPDGSERIRMKYYVKGRFRSGTVYLEKQADENGHFDRYNYLYVELTGYPPKTIVIDTTQQK